MLGLLPSITWITKKSITEGFINNSLIDIHLAKFKEAGRPGMIKCKL